MKRILIVALAIVMMCCVSAFANTLTTNGGQEIDYDSLPFCTKDEKAPVVYYISEISPQSLVKIYEALEWTNTSPTAVKIASGEPPASNYLRPELIEDLVKLVDGTIVECNTAYGGQRAATAEHYQVTVYA